MTAKDAARISAERGMSGSDAVLFRILAAHSGADDMCALNHKRIAKESGLSLSTVKIRLKRMEAAGYIGIIPGATMPYINTFMLFENETGGGLPQYSPYGYITVHTPCGELTGLVTNDRELRQFQRKLGRVYASAHRENAAALSQNG